MDKVTEKKQIILVLTEPTEGNEDEFNRYYEDVHLDEVIKTTGWTLAQRFKLVDEAGRTCPLPYLAYYETTSNDSATAIEVLNESRGKREQSDSLNRRTAGVWVFEATGKEHLPD